MAKDSSRECPDCDGLDLGTLWRSKGNGICKNCDGNGKTLKNLVVALTAPFLGLDDEETCKICNGTGQCQTCGGTGYEYYNSDNDSSESEDTYSSYSSDSDSSSYYDSSYSGSSSTSSSDSGSDFFGSFISIIIILIVIVFIVEKCSKPNKSNISNNYSVSQQEVIRFSDVENEINTIHFNNNNWSEIRMYGNYESKEFVISATQPFLMQGDHENNSTPYAANQDFNFSFEGWGTLFIKRDSDGKDGIFTIVMRKKNEINETIITPPVPFDTISILPNEQNQIEDSTNVHRNSPFDF